MINKVCSGCSPAHEIYCVKFSNTDIIALVVGAALLAVSTYFMMNASMSQTMQILSISGVIIGSVGILYSLVSTILKSCNCLSKPTSPKTPSWDEEGPDTEEVDPEFVTEDPSSDPEFEFPAPELEDETSDSEASNPRESSESTDTFISRDSVEKRPLASMLGIEDIDNARLSGAFNPEDTVSEKSKESANLSAYVSDFAFETTEPGTEPSDPNATKSRESEDIDNLVGGFASLEEYSDDEVGE